MTNIYLFTLSIMLTCLIYNMNHPFFVGMIIFFQTIIYCLITSFYFSSWYSYMLFLIFLGGLLILFIYIASLLPNANFKISKSPLLIIMMIPTFMMIMLNNNNSYLESPKENFLNEWQESLISIFLEKSMLIFIFIMFYLILSLIVFYYITFVKSGAIRLN
uniref:NADH dehydrogenase subunit 6 n=1 Tax=Lynceus grossipedia TaxID=2774322 RepID=UPI0023AA7FC2|nr:NADH dehydrogenase subunit 6 [Lynceus grossipedia]WCD23728.1 NADH dehydrogenase subunit 6 [Lynceus grossipedia]